MASASGLLSCGALALPTELVLVVIECLQDDYQALGSLAATCRALQHLAEEQLYRTIELDTVNALDAVVAALDARRARAHAVHTLRIQYQYKPEHLDDTLAARTAFNAHVEHMVNLRTWHIESPYDNYHWNDGTGGHAWVAGDMETFRAALDKACLAHLERLTIHSHGPHSDFWHLGAFHCLFTHPALRYLHISCVDFPDHIPELQASTVRTPMLHIRFDECVLRPKSLKTILRTPAALRCLTLGENVFNVRRSRALDPALSKDPYATLEALSVVAGSLESLIHHDPGWRLDSASHYTRLPAKGHGLRFFHKLRYLQCEISSFLHQVALMNPTLAPPNLDILRLHRHWNTPDDFFDQAPDAQTYLSLPSLKELELFQASTIWCEASTEDYICEPGRLRSRHACAYKLYQGGINLSVVIEMHKAGLIPPYLHGEMTPMHWPVYNAREVGFRRHFSTGAVSDPVSKDENHPAAAAQPHAQVHSSFNYSDTQADIMPASVAQAPFPCEADLAETDQLEDVHIHVIKSKVRRSLDQLRHMFDRQRRPRHLLGSDDADLEFYATSSGDDEDMDDEDELEDDDMDAGLDLDEGDAIYEDEDGNLYVGVYEMETDEDEEAEEWEDAPEEPATHPDLD